MILDTAGRLSIDQALMDEVRAIREATNPAETLLVVDAMTGQDAVQTARAFNETVGVTGIVLTRMDGDARGGAALSMRAVTGAPIKFSGSGEKIDALEEFHPERVAGRILGLGDIVGLVERASETIDQDEAEKLAKRMMRGAFTLEDYAAQLRQISKMGSISSILGMLPGMGAMKAQIENANIDTSVFKRQQAIIGSDDDEGASGAGDHQGEPEEADCGGERDERSGDQQAAQAVRRYERDDEAYGEVGAEGADAAGDRGVDAEGHGAAAASGILGFRSPGFWRFVVHGGVP